MKNDYVTDSSFKYITSIKSIKLNKNQIISIPDNAFSGMPSLRICKSW